jgi:CBS domain containing-hemolysin-like protein
MEFLYVRNRIDFSTKKQVRDCCKKGNKSAKIALDLANSNKFLSTVQIGITLIELTGIYSGDKITVDVESS